LDEEQKVTLEVARLIREDYLNQNSFTPHDYNCPPAKTFGMLRNLCKFYDLAMAAVQTEQEHKMTWSRIRNTLKDTYDSLINMKFILPNQNDKTISDAMNSITDKMQKAFSELAHS